MGLLLIIILKAQIVNHNHHESYNYVNKGISDLPIKIIKPNENINLRKKM